jgi:hypothetical protein
MLEATKIAEVKDRVQPVLLEEVPPLKLVVSRRTIWTYMPVGVLKTLMHRL